MRATGAHCQRMPDRMVVGGAHHVFRFLGEESRGAGPIVLFDRLSDEPHFAVLPKLESEEFRDFAEAAGLGSLIVKI
jgi:hypothetical protein